MEIRRRFGEYIDEVRLKNNTIIIERGKRKVAAIVPLEMLELLEREREKDVQLVQGVRERNARFRQNEIENDIDEVIKKVRE